MNFKDHSSHELAMMIHNDSTIEPTMVTEIRKELVKRANRQRAAQKRAAQRKAKS